MIDQNSPAIGRFDKSFMIHMIRDFFLVLLLVAVLEFGLKAALVWYGFLTEGAEEAQQVAADIADNVRDIMRNEGGPVAARTIYPILQRNWNDLGFTVAIEPSAPTARAIEQGFGFVPLGIPRGDWAEGMFREGTVSIRAEPSCLSCHFESDVGEELGKVTARSYLSTDFVKWWEDVQLTAGLGLGKIVLHSLLLFLILRARLEPLLGLRAVVSRLARAYGGLEHRAEIRTADEFGALARDLNLFLDRITGLVCELEEVLNTVVRVNDDIVTIQRGLRDQIDGLAGGIRRLERGAMLAAKREPRLSQDWFDAIRDRIRAFDATLEQTAPADSMRDLGTQLASVIAHAEAQLTSTEAVFEGLAGIGDRAEALRGALSEMARLEERLKTVIETGGILVRRLNPSTRPGATPPASGSGGPAPKSLPGT